MKKNMNIGIIGAGVVAERIIRACSMQGQISRYI